MIFLRCWRCGKRFSVPHKDWNQFDLPEHRSSIDGLRCIESAQLGDVISIGRAIEMAPTDANGGPV